MSKTIKEITLTDLLDLALGSTLDRITIPAHIAAQIATVDADEQYCHVEFPLDKKSRPVLWRIADWKTSHARYLRRQALSERQRTIETRASELRARFVKSLSDKTGTPIEMCQVIAAGMVHARSYDAATLLGLDLRELIEADEQLVKFKQENNIK